jgi:hypothetical protein
MLKQKPMTTIAEALGKGKFWECTMDDCHLLFQSENALRQCYSKGN